MMGTSGSRSMPARMNVFERRLEGGLSPALRKCGGLFRPFGGRPPSLLLREAARQNGPQALHVGLANMSCYLMRLSLLLYMSCIYAFCEAYAAIEMLTMQVIPVHVSVNSRYSSSDGVSSIYPLLLPQDLLIDMRSPDWD